MPQGTQQLGIFIPTTEVWDVQQVYNLDISEDFKELLIRLYQNINRMALAINAKESGYYSLTPYSCGKFYFPNTSLNSTTSTVPTYRGTQRLTVNFGTLPNTGSKSVAHNIPITSTVTFVDIRGTSNNLTSPGYIPIPYSSPTLANNIELKVDGTNVTIITGNDRSAYTVTTIVLEYLQS